MGGNSPLEEQITAIKRSIISASEGINSIEQSLKELAVREAEFDKKVSERDQQNVEDKAEMNKRETEVIAKEEAWNEVEKKMEQNAAKLPSVIHFNVSGTRFSVAKEKLLSYEGSLFAQMLTSDHSQQLPSGEIFVERDPKFFPYILSFMLSGALPPVGNEDIISEFEYFKVSLPLGASIFKGLIERQDFIAPQFSCTIVSWLPNKSFQLLFKATRDGFTAGDFHQKCDNKGPTLTVFKSSEGYLFGGYSSIPWESSYNYKTHQDMFIFTLSNPHNIPPTKYSLKQGTYGVYCKASFGPTFGHDIFISSNSNQSNSSIGFPNSYIDTTGHGNTTFTGSSNLTTSDIEVYSVI